MRSNTLTIATVLALLGCSSGEGEDPPVAGPPPAVEDYDRTCAQDDECVLVYEGDPCDECRLFNTAIARSGLEEWEAASRAARVECVGGEPCAADAPDLDAVCVEGLCEAVGP